MLTKSVNYDIFILTEGGALGLDPEVILRRKNGGTNQADPINKIGGKTKMIDSTNPRVMADNIRELSEKEISLVAELVALGTYSTDEVNTGMKYGDDDIYRKCYTGTLPTVETDGTFVIKSLGIISDLKDIIDMYGSVVTATFSGCFPYYTDSGRVTKPYLRNSNKAVEINSNGTFFNDGTYILFIEYTKAAPAPDVSPAPDSRSLEEEPEPDEPINEEPKKEEK